MTGGGRQPYRSVKKSMTVAAKKGKEAKSRAARTTGADWLAISRGARARVPAGEGHGRGRE